MAKKKQKVSKKTTKKVVKKALKKVAKKAAVNITKTKKNTKPTAKKTATKANASNSKLLGQTIGSFSVLNAQGNVFTQDNLKGRKTVLYFYPKDDTPGCTIEGQQFSDLKSSFESANTTVYGVSKDSAESHDKFICKFGFKIDLLSDENEKLCKMFDVIKMKNMYGRKYLGIERSTFVLDENLKVIKEMRKVSPDGHAQEILTFVKSL